MQKNLFCWTSNGQYNVVSMSKTVVCRRIRHRRFRPYWPYWRRRFFRSSKRIHYHCRARSHYTWNKHCQSVEVCARCFFRNAACRRILVCIGRRKRSRDSFRACVPRQTASVIRLCVRLRFCKIPCIRKARTRVPMNVLIFGRERIRMFLSNRKTT